MKDTHQERLTSEQSAYFFIALSALKQRLVLEGINTDLLDLEYNGITSPLPFPDAHWDIVTLWSLIDGTMPSLILLSNGDTIDYTNIILRDPLLIKTHRQKLAYAKTGFRYR